MIKNIVFDLGNVLIDYNPSRIVNAVFTDKSLQDLFLKEIFQSQGWKDLDRGVLTFEDHTQNLVSRFPQYVREIEWILNNWHKDQPDVSGMYTVVERLHDHPFGLYILSNASYRFYNYAVSKKKFFKFFDAVTISAELKLLKPQREIYDHFCQIHNLVPGECLFIDDQFANVKGAIDAGWNAYQFKDTGALRSFLHENINIDF
ncbi:MAG: HAD family phosphatase [Chloroflexota bacterium]|nr:HAD family phosphatase [Chloroflexota bacterium]